MTIKQLEDVPCVGALQVNTHFIKKHLKLFITFISKKELTVLDT